MFHDQQPSSLNISLFPLHPTTSNASSNDTFVHLFSPLIIAMVLLTFVDLYVMFDVSWTYFCPNYYLV
jgi:hypothetical protein